MDFDEITVINAWMYAGVSITTLYVGVCPFMVLSQVLAALHGCLSDLCMSGCYHTYGSDFSVSKEVAYSVCNIYVEPSADSD